MRMVYYGTECLVVVKEIQKERKNQPSENKKSSCYCKNIQAVAHNRLYLKQCYSNFTLLKLFQEIQSVSRYVLETQSKRRDVFHAKYQFFQHNQFFEVLARIEYFLNGYWLGILIKVCESKLDSQKRHLTLIHILSCGQ